ncbi:site-specific DNA-methyltransferase [Thiocapsa sp.]|uniref:site-specific DNA-methyltransferase n=1 Tax=Thiocapsa sp. TaxID=2024551 RepID=UPI002BD72D81|nr:site-specific DNA-methyltransferase [Thiocapsa sp.]HSO82540.1 site-specific DNA-methyltransferase [Thiocapsa sp.]
MKRLDPKTDGASADVTAEHIDALKALFPECVTEGKVDFDILRELLGDEIEERPERYSFNWNGKSRARRIAQTPSTGTLRPCPDESVNWDTTQNIFIEGDNLEVLKLLQKSYHKRVKMIFIDPPYNRGNELIYPDNYKDNLDTYLRYTGQIDSEGLSLSTNSESSGRYHTNWLNMIYPRIRLARNLLRNDGAIFVTIDDHEICNLRRLMDDIFGEENFLACFLWKKMDSPSRNDKTRIVSEYHDYVVSYRRTDSVSGLSQMKKPEILDDYPLELPNGMLARRRQLRKNGKGARRQDRPTMWYPLTAPDGTEVWPVAPPPESWEGRWVLSLETWREREAAGLAEWIKRDYGWVPYYIETAPEDPGIPWPTWWDDLHQSRQSKAAFTDLMKGTQYDFDNPKPINLIRRLLDMATGPSDIVLDFFAGSATTGHAVMEQNDHDGGNRRFILVQLPEAVDEQDFSVADISRERLRTAVALLQNQHDENSVRGLTSSLGFKAFSLASSNIVPWSAICDDLHPTLLDAIENIKPDRSELDILYELLLKYGLDLAVPVEERTIEGKTVYVVGRGALIVCLADEITLEAVEGIAALKLELQPEITRVVFKDAGFPDDVVKTNTVQILCQAGIEDVKSL